MNDLRVNDLFSMTPFDEALRGWMRRWKSDLASQAPQIRLDVTEHDDSYTVKAELPGVRKEDVDVRVDGNLVTIGGEVRKESEERKDGRVLRAERSYGYASRSFTLASAIDEARADARMKDGVLELTLPKKSGGGARQLKVG